MDDKQTSENSDKEKSSQKTKERMIAFSLKMAKDNRMTSLRC